MESINSETMRRIGELEHELRNRWWTEVLRTSSWYLFWLRARAFDKLFSTLPPLSSPPHSSFFPLSFSIHSRNLRTVCDCGEVTNAICFRWSGNWPSGSKGRLTIGRLCWIRNRHASAETKHADASLPTASVPMAPLQAFRTFAQFV